METIANDKGPTGSARVLSQPLVWALAVMIGLVAGVWAVVFHCLIGFLHNLFFRGRISFYYDPSLHTPPSPWGPLIILAPVIGAGGVALLVKHFAPEARGPGVPEVMETIYHDRGITRPIVAVVKSVVSALSIGSGASIGREGPMVQIGSVVGSTAGQLFRLRPAQTIPLMAAGAAAGIAATFNTPIGGILFAVELLLPEISVWTVAPVIISTAAAACMGRLLLGGKPAFAVPAAAIHHSQNGDPWALAACVGLGCLAGLLSTAFIRAVHGIESLFDKKIGGSYCTRHCAGMLVVGVMIYLTMRFSGRYYIEGVGYATVKDVLDGGLLSAGFLIVLLILKLTATAWSLGSGGSGGVFSPLLFIGASLGGAYGLGLEKLFPHIQATPAAFALMGMAGMVGGATGAGLTAILMVMELTLDYNVVLPIAVTVALSLGIRKFLCADSVYTFALTRRHIRVPEIKRAELSAAQRLDKTK